MGKISIGDYHTYFVSAYGTPSGSGDYTTTSTGTTNITWSYNPTTSVMATFKRDLEKSKRLRVDMKTCSVCGLEYDAANGKKCPAIHEAWMFKEREPTTDQEFEEKWREIKYGDWPELMTGEDWEKEVQKLTEGENEVDEFMMKLVARRSLTEKEVEKLQEITKENDWKTRLMQVLLVDMIKSDTISYEMLGYKRDVS